MLLDYLLPNRLPHLDWIQVEVSSYCNASCIYCPHTIYRKNWRNKYLSIELFRRLIPAFQKTSLVYLQGWGEPFAHPLFFEMLKIAKSAGCKVGSTTNGSLLDRKVVEKLVNQELDVIGFSLAGVDEKNDRIRKGTHIKKVLDCMEEIHRVKNRYGTDKPRIHIAYMLLRTQFDELEKIPRFLSNTGAAQTVVSSLSFVASPELETESTCAIGEIEYAKLKERMRKVRSEATSKGADVHLHLASPEHKNFSCTENISKAVVVGSDGSISPCVMKQIPARGKNYYYIKGKKLLQQNLSFGNVNEKSLNTIWRRQDYQEFLREFRQEKPPSICQNCLKSCVDIFT